MRNGVDFNKADIGVFDCIREGWRLIKNDYWLFFGVAFVGMLIAGAVPFYILLGPMQCGIFICLRKRLKGERTDFGDLFMGFNFFGRSLAATLILMSPMLASSAIMFATILPGLFGDILNGRDYEMPPSTMVILFIEIAIANIVHITVQGLAMFTNLLIVDRRMPAWEAIKMSSRAVWHNGWGITLLLLGQGLIGIAGVLCCIVGVYFAMPVIYASALIAYGRIFGITDLAAENAA